MKEKNKRKKCIRKRRIRRKMFLGVDIKVKNVFLFLCVFFIFWDVKYFQKYFFNLIFSLGDLRGFSVFWLVGVVVGVIDFVGNIFFYDVVMRIDDFMEFQIIFLNIVGRILV